MTEKCDEGDTVVIVNLYETARHGKPDMVNETIPVGIFLSCNIFLSITSPLLSLYRVKTHLFPLLHFRWWSFSRQMMLLLLGCILIECTLLLFKSKDRQPTKIGWTKNSTQIENSSSEGFWHTCSGLKPVSITM